MKTILYIEEKPHVRENVIRLIHGLGDFFKILTAGTVVEAIDLLDKIKVDIVIAGRQISAKEADVLENCLRRMDHTQILFMSRRNTRLTGLLKAFEYRLQLESPVDIGLLLEMLLDEFDIQTGGQLRGVSIASFLQMIELEGRTCTVQVLSMGRKGSLYYLSGNLIDAALGDLGGKEAAFAIFNLEKPLITFDYNVPDREKTIAAPLMSLLLESGRMQDELPSKPHEKRRYKRFPCTFPVTFVYQEWSHQSVARDISLSGIFIETRGPFSVGTEIQLTFHSQSLKTDCRVGGVIVRRDASGIGVKFSAAGINQMAILRTIIHEVSGV